MESKEGKASIAGDDHLVCLTKFMSNMQANANTRVVCALFINTIAFSAIMVTVPISSFVQYSYFYFTMLLVSLTGATTSFYQIGVFAAASRFPHKYLQGIMRYVFSINRLILGNMDQCLTFKIIINQWSSAGWNSCRTVIHC